MYTPPIAVLTNFNLGSGYESPASDAVDFYFPERCVARILLRGEFLHNSKGIAKQVAEIKATLKPSLDLRVSSVLSARYNTVLLVEAAGVASSSDGGKKGFPVEYIVQKAFSKETHSDYLYSELITLGQIPFDVYQGVCSSQSKFLIEFAGGKAFAEVLPQETLGPVSLTKELPIEVVRKVINYNNLNVDSWGWAAPAIWKVRDPEKTVYIMRAGFTIDQDRGYIIRILEDF